MKKLIAIAIVIVMSLSISSFAFAEKATTGTAPVKTSEPAKAAVPQEIKDRKVQLKALFDKAKATRSELATTISQIKAIVATTKAGIRNMTAEEKAAARTELLALKEKIKANKTEIEALRTELKAKRELMSTNRTQLKEAIKAANYDIAGTTLDTMLKIKAEKNVDLEKLLDLRIKTLDEIK